MPRKDPEARRQYNKERNDRINADPVLKAKKNADAVAQYHRRAEDPIHRAKLNERSKARYAAMPVEDRRKLHQRANRKRFYGITETEFENMLERQKGVCAICSSPPHRRRKDGELFSLSVDHCHKTGKVRGLLCFSCNLAIGQFDHDTKLLRAAIKFLSR